MTGELTVEHSAVPISSIDIQLLRVESVAAGDRMATETSEIQTTQACAISCFFFFFFSPFFVSLSNNETT